MATKAELEAELAELKKQMARQPDIAPQSADKVESVATEEPQEGADPIEETDWDAEISEVMAHLEEFPHKKPLLFALGAFAIGYMIGRSK